MKEKQKPPRQHSLDRFRQWSRETIEANRTQKGDKNAQKKN